MPEPRIPCPVTYTSGAPHVPSGRRRSSGQRVPPLVAAQEGGAEPLGASGRRVDIRHREVEMGLLRMVPVRGGTWPMACCRPIRQPGCG